MKRINININRNSTYFNQSIKITLFMTNSRLVVMVKRRNINID